MKKILMLSFLVTILGACSHGGGHHGEKSCDGCKGGKPCAMESKDGQKAECEDCKKVK
jgi:hypothetical protein